MKILGNRILVSRIEEDKKEGFQTVEVQDSFVNKGKIEQLGQELLDLIRISANHPLQINEGDTILFAKYATKTQEIDKDHKIISVDDILAVI